MYLVDNKGLLFRYVYNGIEEKYFCVTKDKNKVSEGFIQSYDFYKKEIPIDDPQIESIYDMHYLVDYDTKLECVPTTWKVDEEEITLTGEKILLIFGHGRLPGWEIVENTVCKKMVKIEEVKNIRIVYKYKVKEGKKYDIPLREERTLTIEEFKQMAEYYRDSNI